MKHIFNKCIREEIVFLRFLIIFLIFFSSNNFSFASETNGTIDSAFENAWGENIGWLNFGCDNCNVSITDLGLSGRAWSAQYGWINLVPTTSGVINNGEGELSGFAWGSNLGWIDFSGVTIDQSGEFFGYATVRSDGGRINFNCAGAVDTCGAQNFKVKTDWRPASVRSEDDVDTDTEGGSSGGRRIRNRVRPAVLEATPPILAEIIPLPIPTATPPIAPNPIVSVVNNVGETFSSFYEYILNFLRQQNIPTEISVEIPEIAPVVFQTRWNLLPLKAIRTFVFAPLPYEVRILASKFPELDRTLKGVGIERFTDLTKLTGVSLNLPGLSELTDTLEGAGEDGLAEIDILRDVTLHIPGVTNIGVGKIALIKGLPLVNFSLAAKRDVPAEFVFARSAGELIDLNVAMSIGERGEVIQQISSLPGQILKLVVKPVSSARSVTGYITFKAPTPKIALVKISRSSLSASVLLSQNGLVENAPSKIPVEQKLVLSSFEYTDPDGDGIYTAEVVTPRTPGEYEVITVIDYIDPTLGIRQMRMITVIDPEGYVFEKSNGKETRIPSAVISLYRQNTVSKIYELWGAEEYSQENPQITDVRGTYAFLVPEGTYYFSVEAPGYKSFEGKEFNVTEGAGIHQNIELQSSQGFLLSFDWKLILLIVVLLLLVYNFYRNRLQDKLLKQIK